MTAPVERRLQCTKSEQQKKILQQFGKAIGKKIAHGNHRAKN
jgi:hypothetical protein